MHLPFDDSIGRCSKRPTEEAALEPPLFRSPSRRKRLEEGQLRRIRLKPGGAGAIVYIVAVRACKSRTADLVRVQYVPAPGQGHTGIRAGELVCLRDGSPAPSSYSHFE